MGIHDEKTEETRFGKVENISGCEVRSTVSTSCSHFWHQFQYEMFPKFLFIIGYKNSELTESYCAQDYGFLQWKKSD